MSNGFVFVLMPFKNEFNDVYQLGIKDACKELGLYCERVDEQIYQGGMLDRIYNQIEKADYLIADMSQQNPNVFYEVGYAHGLKKDIILITNNGSDIPFDMKHYKHIIYQPNGIANLKDSVAKSLKWYMENGTNTQLTQPPFTLFFNDSKILYGSNNEYSIYAHYVRRDNSPFTEYSTDFDIRIHNPTSNFYMLDKGMDLILPAILNIPINKNVEGTTYIPNDLQQTQLYHELDFHPDQWHCPQVSIHFDDEDGWPTGGYFKSYEGELRLFFQRHTYKYNLIIDIKNGGELPY